MGFDKGFLVSDLSDDASPKHNGVDALFGDRTFTFVPVRVKVRVRVRVKVWVRVRVRVRVRECNSMVSYRNNSYGKG